MHKANVYASPCSLFSAFDPAYHKTRETVQEPRIIFTATNERFSQYDLAYLINKEIERLQHIIPSWEWHTKWCCRLLILHRFAWYPHSSKLELLFHSFYVIGLIPTKALLSSVVRSSLSKLSPGQRDFLRPQEWPQAYLFRSPFSFFSVSSPASFLSPGSKFRPSMQKLYLARTTCPCPSTDARSSGTDLSSQIYTWTRFGTDQRSAPRPRYWRWFFQKCLSATFLFHLSRFGNIA